jgi:hypothetical protein
MPTAVNSTLGFAGGESSVTSTGMHGKIEVMSEEQNPAITYGDYDENGVDLSLIRWMLSLTPTERLQWMERCARDVEVLRGCAYRSTSPAAGEDGS